MGSKRKNKIRINFSGSNATEVTGSMAHIITSEKEILLECGLRQSTSIKDDWLVNSKRFNFKPKNIDYIFLGHVHMDHSGLIPRLFAEGCTGKVICPKGTKEFFKVMAHDSAYIIARDSEFLNTRYNMKTSPFYTPEDVDIALNHMVEYEFGQVYELDDNIKFKFVHSGHIIAAAQTELWITEGNQTKKILYTSDLGGSLPKFYAEEFEPVEKANLAICESTYSDASRQVTHKDRKTDLAKMKTVIDEVCRVKGGKVLFPTFSLDRTQNILTYLYQIYGKDDTFKIPIIIDSPLAVKLTDVYLKQLVGEEHELLQEVMDWGNVHIVENYEESLEWQIAKRPLVVLAASGFMQAGRSRLWAKKIVPNSNDHIIFIGFASENSLAGKLKDNKNHSIKIDGKAYRNRCGITSLHSFSSHIQHDDMLKYYSDINCDKVCLVHGDYHAKCTFGKELQGEIERKNKTNRVIVANQSTSLLI